MVGVRRGRGHLLFTFERTVSILHVLGDFRADSMPEEARKILAGLPPVFMSYSFWHVDYASH